MNVKDFIAKTTLPTRHGIVKRIAPKLYHDAFLNVPRPTILFVKAIRGNELLTGLEIGVAEGVNAESILKTLRIRKLYLVDPYESYIQDGKLYSSYIPAKDEAVKRLWNFRDRTQIINLKSDEAVDSVPEGLDFAYIDGNHGYEYVKKDIENYYLKVKEKGVIGGHDFHNNYLGVIRAAVEFSSSKRLELMAERSDWWILKP